LINSRRENVISRTALSRSVCVEVLDTTYPYCMYVFFVGADEFGESSFSNLTGADEDKCQAPDGGSFKGKRYPQTQL
jgi:hypothetical protein